LNLLTSDIVTQSSHFPPHDPSPFLEDAAHYPGGHSPGVVFPQSTEDVIEILTTSGSILPIGAQSSLTGGATPMGETILSTSKMVRIVDVGSKRITVEPGVTVAAMQGRLNEEAAWFPPVPTFTGACAGGIVATNAAGAATFKYGSTREWVQALTVILADGTALEIQRGMHRARNGRFEIETARGRIVVPVPSYTMPRVAKCSAGYFAAPDMDLIDLFIGSEGTLGVITQITFATVSPAPNIILALVFCSTEAQGLSVVESVRNASTTTWRTADASGIDACAIEYMDRRSLDIVRDDGADRRHNVSIPSTAALALLVQLEISATVDAEEAFAQVQSSLDATAMDTGLTRFCRLLDEAGLLAETEIALPHDRRRAADLLAIREAVPTGVNQRVSTAKRTIDPRIEKVAGDMVVPFERTAEMMDVYRKGYASRGLDYAIWGHLSDGNVHPNVIPTSFDDVTSGKAALMDFGHAIATLGGCPLAEHGVGRNPIKQALLRQLYGDTAIDEMRAIKRALDPEWRLAPGVIFAPP
jgi:D-lactate dehydrogenase (cytochrome)